MVCEEVLSSAGSQPPINLFYCHYHNCIRSELELLSASVSALDSTAGDAIAEGLAALKGRVAFLERVYSIHSSVEDEARSCPPWRCPIGQKGLDCASKAMKRPCDLPLYRCTDKLPHLSCAAPGGLPSAGLEGQERHVRLQRGARGRGALCLL